MATPCTVSDCIYHESGMAVDNLEDDTSLILISASAPEERETDAKLLGKRCVLLVMISAMKYYRIFCVTGEG